MTVERSLARFISTMATAAWNLMPRWGRWLSAIVLVLWLWAFLLQARHGGASIVVHSVIDRPISYVYVNGKMGSNTFSFDGLNAGGGSAGPYRIDGDMVKIDWLLSTTLDQLEKEGLRPEKHSITLPMPKREKGQNNFHVIFLPDNKVMVRWGGWAEPVMNEVIDTYRTRK